MILFFQYLEQWVITLLFFGNIYVVYTIFNGFKNLWKEHEQFFIESSDSSESESKKEEETKETKSIIPYEEKYLKEIRTKKNEYVFTEEELILEQKILNELKEEHEKKILQSIQECNDKIEELKSKLAEHECKEQTSNMKKDSSILQKIQDSLKNEIKINESKISELQENMYNNIEELEQQAKQHIIDEQLKKFKKNFIIENTPLGNVLMFYNHDKLAFEYYSDLTIPYRYLEVIARKYVLTFDYRPLYIDMEEELKEYEKKMEQKEQEKKNIEKKEEDNDKKSKIFAKFKSYNTEAGNGRVNAVPPPKNNIPQNRFNVNKLLNKEGEENKNNDKILLKERSNRYSYQGKFCNFNILQKIDKKVVDKKYAFSYADFKKKMLEEACKK